MVRLAQGSKAPVQKTVDKVAGIFVPVVIAIAVISFIVWMLFGDDISQALLAMVSVLVIACPCALGLATPTALVVGMGKGARNGILIKDAESMERIHQVNTIVLDKTGTLTEGKPAVTGIYHTAGDPPNGVTESILLALMTQSAHPLADAIAAFLTDKSVKKVVLDAFENKSGRGVQAFYQGDLYLAGNMKFMEESGILLKEDQLGQILLLQEQAQTVVCFAARKEILAIVSLADTIKTSSIEAVKQLKDEGISIIMLTGDNIQTAKVVAAQTGIEVFRSNLLPGDKAGFVKQLQREGKIVAMAGDGINDSQAMAEADVSIAMGKGSDIAMDVAGMTIISSDLRLIGKAIRLSRLTVRTIRQNLFWAFIYNLVGIPVAAGVLYPVWGFMLNPMIAAAAMALSSVSVVSNSLGLRRKKL
jgi:Cu2+-exporting ATPase